MPTLVVPVVERRAPGVAEFEQPASSASLEQGATASGQKQIVNAFSHSSGIPLRFSSLDAPVEMSTASSMPLLLQS